jgi:hypothetical protein
MSVNNFLHKENLNTLWDVISDEEIFRFLSRDIQSSVAELFTNNVNGFFDIEKTKTKGLIELNKKYILLILKHIERNYTLKVPNKLKILDEKPNKEIITAEELHNERKSQFEKDLLQRQEEFEGFINVKIPPAPEFSDKLSDKPISDMDRIIKEMKTNRNYEVEQITKNMEGDNGWLNSTETSVKSEKITKQDPNKSIYKYLNKDNHEQLIPKKSVTWENNVDITDTELEENIFKKLKKVRAPEIETNMSLSFVEKNNYDNNDDKIKELQTEVKTLNSKLDMIIKLLQK